MIPHHPFKPDVDIPSTKRYRLMKTKPASKAEQKPRNRDDAHRAACKRTMCYVVITHHSLITYHVLIT